MAAEGPHRPLRDVTSWRTASSTRRGGKRSTTEIKAEVREASDLRRERPDRRPRRGVLPASTRRPRKMATKSLLEAIHDGLAEEMRADETVMILGEDVGRAGGVFRVTQGLQEEFGEARVMDTPLAESLIVGSAIGLSVNGMRPVAEIQFADFIPPAFDQIVSEAAHLLLPVERRLRGPDHHPRPLRRGPRRRALPLPVRRGVVLQHPGPQGRRPDLSRRRQGRPQERHPRPEPRALPRAQKDLPALQGRGAGRRTTPSPWTGRRSTGRGRT